MKKINRTCYLLLIVAMTIFMSCNIFKGGQSKKGSCGCPAKTGFIGY